MTENKKKDNAPESSKNIFHILDGIVQNVDKTKKLVVAMVIAIVISIPVSFHMANVLADPPYSFGLARIIVPFFVIIGFIVVGIKQWLVLSKWTKKYKTYKELQKKIDEKFDFEGSSNEE